MIKICLNLVPLKVPEMVTYACVVFVHLPHPEKMCSETPHQQSYCIGRRRPDVSGPIRSVKMYSCVQCTMQKRSVCCRDVSGLAHMEQGPGPSSLSTHPLLIFLGTGDSVYQQPPTRMDLDSGVDTCKQPNPEPVVPDNVCWYCLYFHLEYSFLKCLSNDYLHSTDCCYIFRLTTTRNKWIPLCAFITFSCVALRTVTYWVRLNSEKISQIYRVNMKCTSISKDFIIPCWISWRGVSLQVDIVDMEYHSLWTRLMGIRHSISTESPRNNKNLNKMTYSRIILNIIKSSTLLSA